MIADAVCLNPTLPQKIEATPIIFTGKVADVQINTDHEEKWQRKNGHPELRYKVMLDLIRTYKGTIPATVEMYSNSVPGKSTAAPFRKGESYLVYAFTIPDPRRTADTLLYFESHCTPLTTLSAAHDEITYLEQHAKEAP